MADKATQQMADPPKGKTASEGKDLNKPQPKDHNDVEVHRDRLGEDSDEGKAEANLRVGPKVEGLTTRGYEFPVPEHAKPAVLPADQKPS